MYRGRFAPSPSGPLHFGSLVAATASYLEARTQGGEWLVRMEDLDTPRVVSGAADEILRTLEAYGFSWDGPVMYQSQRNHAYQAALAALQAQGLAYPCGCSRKEIADSVTLHSALQGNSALQGIEGLVYPGTCRHGLPAGKQARAWRVLTDSRAIQFVDAVQGLQSQRLDTAIGDFVLKRADGLYAYQLAVVVDDAEQQISHVLRGADLLDSTARQRYLQQLLGLSQVHYAHVPVASNAAGEKLSKQTLAKPLDSTNAGTNLWHCLRFLGQLVPQALQRAPSMELWQWALAHWKLEQVPQQRSIRVDAH
ncbi:tRNA glutamyl-Q(34) synthetase GluQRS [Methylobacillus flagellatus]|uniref:tRNA glutamyl-Q(34) synthetase GluQRS n=1 Tax=Methylobacillus flagellatus TaxID=405 RepID=UPI0010F6E2E9|nr:tRNA glutamyl-Q(34) synthetase GluQRS [Methylobacillus flagellatus]